MEAEQVSFGEIITTIMQAILGIGAGFSILIIFPSVVAGIVLLVVYFSKEGAERNKKHKWWGIFFLVFPFALLIISLLGFAIISFVSRIFS